jgi:hypothetical protein
MKKKKVTPIKQKLFFLTVPIYDIEVCVVVGMNHQEALAVAKKQKCTKDFIETLNGEKVKESCGKMGKIADGVATRIDSAFFLFLQPYKNDWKYLDTLNHEVFHLTQFISTYLTMWEDMEPTACLHEWLFKELRETLSGNKK